MEETLVITFYSVAIEPYISTYIVSHYVLSLSVYIASIVSSFTSTRRFVSFLWGSYINQYLYHSVTFPENTVSVFHGEEWGNRRGSLVSSTQVCTVSNMTVFNNRKVAVQVLLFILPQCRVELTKRFASYISRNVSWQWFDELLDSNQTYRRGTQLSPFCNPCCDAPTLV